jgi:Fic family protein
MEVKVCDEKGRICPMRITLEGAEAQALLELLAKRKDPLSQEEKMIAEEPVVKKRLARAWKAITQQPKPKYKRTSYKIARPFGLHKDGLSVRAYRILATQGRISSASLESKCGATYAAATQALHRLAKRGLAHTEGRRGRRILYALGEAPGKPPRKQDDLQDELDAYEDGVE